MYGSVPLTERKAELDDQLTPETQVPSEQSAVPQQPAAPPVEPPKPEKPAEASATAKTRGKWRLILAAVVIVAGVVYLLQTLGWFGGQWDISHWWGFLILIPAVASFLVAWWVCTKKARRLSWNVVRWPVLAIIVGVGIALSWKG